MTTVRFEGCEPWPLDNEIIELVIAGVGFDLHNDADLTALGIDSAQGLSTVALTFRARPLPAVANSGDVTLVVEFRGVSRLILSADLDVQHEVGVFSSFEYRGGDSLGFQIDWLEAQLEADAVVASIVPGG